MKAQLEERIKVVEEEFKKLDDKKKECVEQRRKLDQVLSEIQTRQVQLQGSYKELTELSKTAEACCAVQ